MPPHQLMKNPANINSHLNKQKASRKGIKLISNQNRSGDARQRQLSELSYRTLNNKKYTSLQPLSPANMLKMEPVRRIINYKMNKSDPN